MVYTSFTMTITQLEYFVTVVKTNNISKAAKQLFVSQPAVSSAIKELEKEFNTTLFVRYNNQIVLTDEGHHLYKLSLNLLQNCTNLYEDMKNYVKKSSVLKIGVPPMLGSFIVPSLVQAYTREHQNIEVQLIELGSVANQEAILDGEISCGFTVKHHNNVNDDLDFIKIVDTSLLFAINKNHPLAKKDVISFEDIKNTPLILMKEDCLQSSLVQNEFEKRGLKPNIKIRTNQLYTIKELLSSNNLGAFLFTQVFKYDSEDIKIIPLSEPLDFEIILAWKKNTVLSDAMKEFIDYVVEEKRK